MNTDDVLRLARSGSLFCALGPKSMQKLLILRRLLCIDTPNTSHDVIITDEGLTRCSDEDTLFSSLYSAIVRGVTHHTKFIESPEMSPCSVFTTIEDEYFNQKNILYTKERPAIVPEPTVYKWGSTCVKETPKEYLSGPYLRKATGTALKSLAVVCRPIGDAKTPHRCSIQILTLPGMDPEAMTAIRTRSPRRFNTTTSIRDPPLSSELLTDGCPMSREIVCNYRQSQHFLPNCCFGLYCPSIEDEGRVNRTLQDRAPYTSSRWVGFYWVAGATIPQLALVAGVTPEGMPKAIQVKGNVIVKENDVLSIEVVPKDVDSATLINGNNNNNNMTHTNGNNNNNDRKEDKTSEEIGRNTEIVFFINGNEVLRLSASDFRPTCKYLEKCHFAVQLCTGASVALLSGQCP